MSQTITTTSADSSAPYYPAIRMYPGHAIAELADFAFDGRGRETMVITCECAHGKRSTIVCSETRTLAQVRVLLAEVALDACGACRSVVLS